MKTFSHSAYNALLCEGARSIVNSRWDTGDNFLLVKSLWVHTRQQQKIEMDKKDSKEYLNEVSRMVTLHANHAAGSQTHRERVLSDT